MFLFLSRIEHFVGQLFNWIILVRKTWSWSILSSLINNLEIKKFVLYKMRSERWLNCVMISKMLWKKSVRVFDKNLNRTLFLFEVSIVVFVMLSSQMIHNQNRVKYLLKTPVNIPAYKQLMHTAHQQNKNRITTPPRELYWMVRSKYILR